MAIGRVNTGGGGTGGELTINAPAGVTVIAVNSATEKTYTKTTNSSGVAVFKGLPEGGYNVHIEQVSNETEPITVTVAYKSSATIAWFAATINVTYPAGSTCTCTKGGTTFTASDTSGSYTFTVPSTGTWTVSCTDGDKSKSKDVSITEDGQSETVLLAYGLTLFDNGEQYASITGGWQGTGNNEKNTIYEIGDTLRIRSISSSYRGMVSVYTEDLIDLSGYTTLNFDVISSTTSGESWTLGVTASTPTLDSVPSWIASKQITNVSRQTINLDISSVSTSCRVSLTGKVGDLQCYKITVE